jgi:hypothetical protein
MDSTSSLTLSVSAWGQPVTGDAKQRGTVTWQDMPVFLAREDVDGDDVHPGVAVLTRCGNCKADVLHRQVLFGTTEPLLWRADAWDGIHGYARAGGSEGEFFTLGFDGQLYGWLISLSQRNGYLLQHPLKLRILGLE